MEHVLSCVTLGVPSTENVKGGLSHGELGGGFIGGHRELGCDFGVSCEARMLRVVAGYPLPPFSLHLVKSQGSGAWQVSRSSLGEDG